MKKKYPYKVEDLPYSYDALEPYIDSETMKLHHDKHYQAYVDNLNNALKNYPRLQERYLVDLLSNPQLLPINIRKTVIDNGGGVYNHQMYFRIMGNINENNDIENVIKNRFKSMNNFKEIFKKAAMNIFGSGWTWLVSDRNNNLLIMSTPNQNTPLPFGMNPLLGLDLWEHAYYKKYENRKAEYIDNWFNVINWDEVAKRYKKTSK